MFLQFSVSFRQNSSFTEVFHSIGRVTPNARPMGRRLWEWFACAVFPEWGTGPVCASRVCPGSPRCLFLCLFSDEVRNHTISDVPIGIATATAIPVPTRKRGAPLRRPGPPVGGGCYGVRGGLLSSLGGVVIRIRILMYCDVSCVYPEGYMYLSCILMYPKCILNALLHSKRIHVS